MTRHLWYLVARGLRNRLHRQAQRLRRPRYAAAVLVGIAYFYFAFGGSLTRSPESAAAAPLLAAGRTIGPLLLALLASWWWLWGGHRHALRLSPAETHLLLPAPLTRRQIVQLKIMQAQIGIAFSAVLGTLLLRGGGLPWPVRLLSLWTMVATLQLHQIGASLVHAAAEEHGRSGLKRQALPLALFGTAFVTLLWSLADAINAMRSGPSFDAVARFGAMFDDIGPRIVLAPFRAVTAPVFADSPAAWVPAFGIAVVLLALHYVWVQRTDAAFEEAAVEAGARHAELVAAMRTGGAARMSFTRARRAARLGPALLPLPPLGTPAYALFWKNVLFAQRLVRPLTIGLLLGSTGAMLVLGASSAATLEQGLRNMGIITAVLAVLMTLAGPAVFRLDLRMDLRYVDLLRTYPLTGRDVVAAEIAATTITVSMLQLVLLAATFLLLGASGVLSAWEATAGMLAASLAAPVLSALGVCIQNAIALLYPGWVRLGADAAGGMEDMGQNIMTLAATIITLAVALLPAAVVGAVVAVPLALQAGVIAVPAGVVAALATIAGEVVLLVLWLGRLYDSTDPVVAGLLAR